MNRLDDLLDHAAADLRTAIDRMLTEDSLDVARHGATEVAFPMPPSTLHRSRRLLVAVSIGIAAVVAGGLLAFSRGASDRDAPTASTVDAAPPPAGLLALPYTPDGYAPGQRVTRPAGSSDSTAAVLVKRDGTGAVIQKVTVRAGNLGVYPAGTPIAAPANLPTATGGNVQVSPNDGYVRVQLELGTNRRLLMEAHEVNALVRDQLADEMEQLIAVLGIGPSNEIDVVGTPPAGWELAATGSEPENGRPTYVQGFEVDKPDGGAKIIVSNIVSDDPAMPYWEMLDTLTPIEVRGHAGFLSLDANVYTGPAPVPTLIWAESDGRWVTLRADGMTTEQLLDLAGRLIPVAGDWTSDTATTTTTTTTNAPHA